MDNASNEALKDAQKAFRGTAREINVKNDDDVMKIIHEIRYDKS